MYICYNVICCIFSVLTLNNILSLFYTIQHSNDKSNFNIINGGGINVDNFINEGKKTSVF